MDEELHSIDTTNPIWITAFTAIGTFIMGVLTKFILPFFQNSKCKKCEEELATVVTTMKGMVDIFDFLYEFLKDADIEENDKFLNTFKSQLDKTKNKLAKYE